ncbi:hypothetical protein GGR55DRAFT_700208 [Xylaria sp. FL0064]|nr:hypothetical protein GGR55DRAFT_700208 [Xylaria sp. FL0064]
MSDIFQIEVANFMVFVGARPPSCTGTNSVAIFREELQGRDVYLDTPGFDDANRQDIETLTAVTHYLSVSHANNVWINGILHLHPISDTRIGSSTRRNLDMMRALCGEDAFRNVAIVTTMWASGQSETEVAKQCSREQELRDIYLRDMLTRGSRIVRHDQCQMLLHRRISAKSILTQMEEEYRRKEIEYNSRQREDELAKLRLKVENLRLETKLKLHTTKKVKYEWKGPLVEGLVAGGIGLVGASITAVIRHAITSTEHKHAHVEFPPNNFATGFDRQQSTRLRYCNPQGRTKHARRVKWEWRGTLKGQLDKEWHRVQDIRDLSCSVEKQRII